MVQALWLRQQSTWLQTPAELRVARLSTGEEDMSNYDAVAEALRLAEQQTKLLREVVEARAAKSTLGETIVQVAQRTISFAPLLAAGPYWLIDYTNYRDERAPRWVRVESIRFDESNWHPGKTWILHAQDIARQVYREFDLRRLHNVLIAQHAPPDAKMCACSEFGPCPLHAS
jgi:hypothetical protein